MTASSTKSKWISNYFLWLLAGTAIGALLSSLACSQFQHHVRVFYPRGMPNSSSLQFIAAIAAALRPFALVGPALGPLYYCWRNGLTTVYLIMSATPAAIAGWLLSPSLQGKPDQPFIYVVPFAVFLGTVTALAIQVFCEDWIANETPAPIRPKHIRSTTTEEG